jgi:hypothetical protein
MTKRASLAILLSALTMVSAHARADEPDKAACHGAYEQGQRLRRGKKLIEAREKLLLCARDPCPAVFQPECAKWLGELDAEVPTVVVALEGKVEGDGAHVLVDGAPFSPQVDGIARPIDPGPHEFVIETDRVRIAQKATIVEGEKAQRVVVTGVAGSGAERPPGPERPVPPLAIGVGALGVAALGTSAVFGLIGLGQKSDIDKCTPNCTLDDVHSARRTFLVSDVALGVGLVAVGAAVVLYVTRPTQAAESSVRGPAALLQPISF